MDLLALFNEERLPCGDTEGDEDTEPLVNDATGDDELNESWTLSEPERGRGSATRNAMSPIIKRVCFKL